MDDHKIVQRNLALQREWYGEPLGDRVRRLIVAFDVSQADLADVIGISPPMLSQVMSGRRAKIGNPAVFAKLIMLERKVLDPDVAIKDSRALELALEDVRAARPTVGRTDVPVRSVTQQEAALAALRDVAEEENLGKAAERLEPDFPITAELLRRASNGRWTPN